MDKLNNISVVWNHKGDKWLDPREYFNLKPEQYLYFATSVFWRASVGKWKGASSVYKNALVVKYSEEIRLYLLGERTYPNHACVAVFIDNSDHYSAMTSFPSVTKEDGFHNHIFIIPGIKFIMLVGKNTVNPSSLYYKENIAFIRSDFSNPITNQEFKKIRNLIKNSVVAKGRLDKGN
ncbi:MAG: hypothetical protein WDZ29_03325 [Balneolaceae bacterium]